MCGFLGLIKKTNQKVSPEKIEGIISDLRHRGPDANGYWEDSSVLLVHTRLKIIDPSEKANQPFFSYDGRYVILYNGFCYNYKSIKRSLHSSNERLHTNSDTEVILRAYMKWGSSFIDKIAGMFSIFIYDTKKKEAFICRDRLGIKPLYTAETEYGILFSSEISPILRFVSTSVNPNALWSFFNFRFTQGENTIFQGVYEFPPGTYQCYKKHTLLYEKKYWDCRNIKGSNYPLDNSPNKFLETFDLIIGEHNIADTPIAAFLSGGIDSASVVAASRKKGFFPKTFTFSTGLENDESARAREIAQSLCLENDCLTISGDYLQSYKKALKYLEDPIGDSIILPSMVLAQHVSKNYRVVLSGEGCDEIFSSYIHHLFLNLENKIYQYTPCSLWSLISQLLYWTPQTILELFFPYPSALGRSGKSRLLQHLGSMNSEIDRYTNLVGLFEDSDSKQIFNPPLSCPAEIENYWNSMNDLSFPDKLKRFDLHYWARNYTLHRSDRLAMMFSLEARVPFFDHRLVELVLKMNTRNIYNYQDPKNYFRNCLANSDLRLSTQTIKRKKQAFYLPIEKIFSPQEIQIARENILDNARKRNIYNYRILENFLNKDKLELLDAKQFQCLFNYELWCQEFID